MAPNVLPSRGPERHLASVPREHDPVYDDRFLTWAADVGERALNFLAHAHYLDRKVYDPRKVRNDAPTPVAPELRLVESSDFVPSVAQFPPQPALSPAQEKYREGFD